MNRMYNGFRLMTLSVILITVALRGYGQNCSINAGTDKTTCYASSFELQAVTGGSLSLTPGYLWAQTAGPSVTIQSPNELSTTISGVPASGGIFTFSFSALCLDGQRTSDEVTITIHGQVTADAGPATQVFCLSPGQSMAALAPPVGQSGVWQVAFGSSDGLGIAGSNNPAAPVTITADPAPQLQNYSYNWVVTDAQSGCFSSDGIAISVINMPSDPATYTVSGATPTGANSFALTTSSCYTSGEGQSVSLAIEPTGGYYYGGSGPVNGTWTLVSKPAGAPDPQINNVYYSAYYTASGLVAGEYVFKWNLLGLPCVNVEKMLTVTVPPTSGGVTKPVGYTNPNIPVKSNYLCDPSSGATPFTYAFDFSTLLPGGALQSGEVISWIPYNTLANGTTIQNANSLQPSFQGLAGKTAAGNNETNYYQYLYTISNPSTGCSINGIFPMWVGTPASLSITNESANVLPCGTTEFIMEYRTEGAFNDFTQDLNIRFVQTTTPAGSVPPIISVPFDVVTTGNISTGKIRISNLTTTGTYAFQLEYGSARYCGVSQHLLNVYVSIPPIANGGSNQRLTCGATATQLVGSYPGGSPILWSQVSGPSPALFDNNRSQTPSVTGLVPGTYVFRYSLQGSGTCLGSNASDDNVAVLVTPADDVASSTATPDQTVCAGAEVILNGNTPAAGQTGLWSVSPLGPALDNANSPTVRVLSGTMAPSITYTFTWTVTGGCNSASDDVLVTTTAAAGPIQAIAGTDACLPEATTSFALSGNSPGPGSSGTWSVLNNPPGVSFNDPNLATPTVTVPGIGDYEFVYTIQTTGCGQTTDTVLVSVAPQPTTANAGPDVLVCGSSGVPFQTATLSATNAVTGTGVWQQVGGPAGASIANMNSPQTTVGNLTQGATYRFEWKVTSGIACSVNNKDTMNVTVAQEPTLLVSDPSPGCSPGSVDITSSAVTIGSDPGSLSYWSDAAATTPLNSPGAITTPGLYYIKLTSANNCSHTEPVTVRINPVATAADIVVTGNMAVPLGSSTTLAASSPTAVNPVFRWYSDPGLTNLLFEGSTFVTPPITAATSFYVSVSGDNLCENTTASVLTETVVLPLRLISFDGRSDNVDNVLVWTTTAEENVCCFDVERSSDGLLFSAIGRIKANNLAIESKYRFSDSQVEADYYYRLKMIDENGEATYSQVIRIKRNLATASLQAYPNPFNTAVNMRITMRNAGKAEWQLYNNIGMLIKKQVLNLSTGTHQVVIDGLGQLPPGQYSLKLITPLDIIVTKMVKQ